MLSYLLLLIALMICTALALNRPRSIHQARHRWERRVERSIRRAERRMRSGKRIEGNVSFGIPDLALLYQKKRSRTLGVVMRSDGAVTVHPTFYGKLKGKVTGFVGTRQGKGIIAGAFVAVVASFVINEYAGLLGAPFIFGLNNVWNNGTADGKWSTDGNWSLGHVPADTETAYFDATSTANCSADSTQAMYGLTMAAGYTGTITQSVDMYIGAGGYSQAGGTFTGVTTKYVYCSGNFVYTAGTITTYKINLKMSGSGTSIGVNSLFALEITSNVTISPPSGVLTISGTGSFLKTNVNTILTISSGKYLQLYASDIVNGITNLGTIAGPGTLKFLIYGANNPTSLSGTISSPLLISELSGGGSNSIVILRNDIVTTSTVTVNSDDGTKTCTLDTNGHSLAYNTLTVGTRGALANSSATKSVVRGRSFDSSAGTFTPTNILMVLEGVGTLKLAAGGAVESLIAKGSAMTTLASNVTISNLYAHINPFALGGFTLTQTHPENEYTGLRRPMVKRLRKLDIGPVGLTDGWLQDLGALV